MSRVDIKQADVFISWTGKDKKIKDEIVSYFKKHGLIVLESPEECVGNYLEWSIEAAKSATVFLLVLTENIRGSKNVPYEILSALQMDDAANRIIVPCSSRELFCNLPFGNMDRDELRKYFKDSDLDDIDPDKLHRLHVSTIDIEEGHSLSADQLEEICHKTELLIINRADSLYRENSKPDFLKFVSLSVRRGCELQGAFDKYYLSRTVTDSEDEKKYDGKELLTEKGDIFFLYGPAGSGKSQYVRRLYGAMDDDTVVISLSCAAAANSGQELFNDMLDEFKRKLGDKIFYNGSDFVRLLSSKHLLLVLDGLDEIATENGIRKFIDKVERYFSPHRDNMTILFTGRDAKDADMIALGGRPTKKLKLDELTDHEIETFGNNLFLMFGAADMGKEFYVRVKDLNSEIKTNPLLLSQLAIIYKDSGKMPETIVGLFDAVAEITFRMDVSKEIETPAAYEDMLRDIGHILKIFSRERYGLLSKGKMVEPLKIFTHILRSNYQDFEARAEFLIEYLQSRAILTNGEFYHKLFLEYFTAVSYYEECFDDYDELKSGSPILRELFAHYADAYWARVIQMFLIKADSRIDEAETERLYCEIVEEIGDADRTLLFDVCRDLIVFRDAAQTTVLFDLLLKSVRKECPPYGPLCWYVPEYSMYAALLHAAGRICKDKRASALECAQAVALTRDVCYLYSRKNTCAEITDKVDGRALFKAVSDNLSGVRRALCELFYLGETESIEGIDVYPRCFNPAETAALQGRGYGIGDRMTQPFQDELGLYEHESYNDYLGEYWGFVSCPYDDNFELTLCAKTSCRVTGLAFSPAGRTEYNPDLKFYCKSVQIIYYSENTNPKKLDYPTDHIDPALTHTHLSTKCFDTVIGDKFILYLEEKIVLPYDRTELEKVIFEFCFRLKEVTLSDGIEKVDDSLFAGCFDLREVHLPGSINLIGAYAFSSCRNLCTIHIPESVETIGTSAFFECRNLKTVLPKSVKSIGPCAFTECQNLQNISLPSGLQELGFYAFADCENLTEINIPDGITEIEEGVFAGCKKLEKVILPSSIIAIKKEAFNGCLSLKEIDIPSPLLKVGSKAFGNCESLSKINIPYGITEIAPNLFQGCIGLEVVFLPNSIAVIQQEAFRGCSSLKEINIPRSVTEIGDNAFEECVGLRNVYIPDGVTKLGNEVFAGCGQLRKAHIGIGVLEIGNDVFAKCNNLEALVLPVRFKNRVQQLGIAKDTSIEWLETPSAVYEITKDATVIEEALFMGNDLTEIDIPYGIREIKKNAFKYCRCLKRVTLPETLTEIGEAVFDGCESLEEIVLPASLIHIGENCFRGCSSLREIYIPKGVKEIESRVFEDCKRLRTVSLPDSLEKIEARAFENCVSLEEIDIPRVKKIGEGAFSSCNSLKEISIPDSINKIEVIAFAGCGNLQTVRLPHHLRSIAKGAFAMCRSLKEIFLPDGVSEIRECAFQGCGNLQTVRLPHGLKNIERGAFQECSCLREIVLPDSIHEIQACTFSGCSNLQTIHLPHGLKTVSYRAFEKCSRLEEIVLPFTVTEIGSDAFASCSSLREIVLPFTVTEIGSSVFAGCSSLTKIVLPQGVTKIHVWSFKDCNHLQEINFPKNLTEIESEAFAGCSSLREIKIPEGLEHIWQGAFMGCSGLKEVVIPQRVYEIRDDAFAGCTELEKIVIGGNFRNDIKRIFGNIDESIIEYF